MYKRRPNTLRNRVRKWFFVKLHWFMIIHGIDLPKEIERAIAKEAFVRL